MSRIAKYRRRDGNEENIQKMKKKNTEGANAVQKEKE